MNNIQYYGLRETKLNIFLSKSRQKERKLMYFVNRNSAENQKLCILENRLFQKLSKIYIKKHSPKSRDIQMDLRNQNCHFLSFLDMKTCEQNPN